MNLNIFVQKFFHLTFIHSKKLHQIAIITLNEQVTIIYELCHMEMKIVTFDRKFQ